MKKAFYCIAILVVMLSPAHGAKCKVGNEWYDYNHYKCSGISPTPSPTPRVTLLKGADYYLSGGRAICAEDWTKRGVLDRRMFDHCYEQQSDAYFELVELDKENAHQRFYANTSFPHCVSEWTKRGVPNPRMMAHCLNNEIEGILDVMHMRKLHGEDRVNRVVGIALDKFGSWRMAAHMVEQAFQ